MPLGNRFEVQIKTRPDFPMYKLKGYRLRGTFYGQGNIPVEQTEVILPHLTPGTQTRWELAFGVSESPVRVHIEVSRPTGFSVCSQDWKP
jgi:hypothetical protein